MPRHNLLGLARGPWVRGAKPQAASVRQARLIPHPSLLLRPRLHRALVQLAPVQAHVFEQAVEAQRGGNPRMPSTRIPCSLARRAVFS